MCGRHPVCTAWEWLVGAVSEGLGACALPVCPALCQGFPVPLQLPGPIAMANSPMYFMCVAMGLLVCGTFNSLIAKLIYGIKSTGRPLPSVGSLGGVVCTACLRRPKTPTLLFGEGACLVWHIYASESRP